MGMLERNEWLCTVRTSDRRIEEYIIAGQACVRASLELTYSKMRAQVQIDVHESLMLAYPVGGDPGDWEVRCRKLSSTTVVRGTMHF